MPGLRYESVGRGFESLPSHQEKPEHVCVLVFLFCLRDGRGSNRAAAHSAASNQPSGLLLSRGFQRVGMSTVEAVNRKIHGFFVFPAEAAHTCTLSAHFTKKPCYLCIACTACISLHKKRIYAKSTCVSSRRSSASICRMASRIILPVIFVATGVLFSGGSCGFAPATSCE